VTLYNRSTGEMIMIEHLMDKPADQSVEQWLDDVEATTDLNPRVSEEWITLNGKRALKVINRHHDSTESENLYIVHGSLTFAVRTERNTPSYRVYQQILATLRFTSR
jgi:hypothetical protein